MIDNRRYQWIIGGVGLLLVIAFSVHMLGKGGRATVGVPAGQKLYRFVAPLAGAEIDADANVAPHCDVGRPARDGLNVCDRGPLVLAFFVPGAKSCVRAVDALGMLTPRAGTRVAALAVGASRAATRKLVRADHWTLPVAYDPSGAVGALYDVTACPLIEVARSGGVVTRRLIGNHWDSPTALARALGSSTTTLRAVGGAPVQRRRRPQG
jgi:hypothetical protein